MKYNKQLIAMLIMTSFLAPQVIFAAGIGSGAGTGTSTPKYSKTNMFCENLGTTSNNSRARLTENIAKRETKLNSRQAEMQTKRNSKDQKVLELRAEALKKQEANFDKILAKATTTEQKLAVNEFISSVKQAVTVRQEAVNAYRNTYRSGVDQVLAERKNKLETAIALNKTATENAIAKAKTDCANGVDNATVRANLQNSIRNAHESFKATINGMGKISDSLKKMAEIRKTSFEKAHSDFRDNLEALKVTLKAKLGLK